MAVDKNAPIIPCGGAASIILGLTLEIAVPNAEQDYISEQVMIAGMSDVDVTRYRSDCVDFWTDREKIVYQVMVHGEYAGKFLGKIGIGSLLSDVEQLFGAITVIDENLVVKGLLGIAFEPQVDMPDSPIIEIYVWQPDWAEIRQHQVI